MDKKAAHAVNCCCAETELVACCYPDGVCDDLTVADCLASGGTPGNAGSECLGTECAAVGPCCTDLDCVLLTEEECLAASGVFLGDGGTCDDGTCETCDGFGVLCDNTYRVVGTMSSTECSSGTVEGCTVATSVLLERAFSQSRWQYTSTGSSSAGPHEGTCFECEVTQPDGTGCEWGGVTLSATVQCDSLDPATGLPIWKLTGALKSFKPLTFNCSGGSAPKCSTCRLIQGTDTLSGAPSLCPSGSISITDFDGVTATFTVEAA